MLTVSNYKSEEVSVTFTENLPKMIETKNKATCLKARALIKTNPNAPCLRGSYQSFLDLM